MLKVVLIVVAVLVVWGLRAARRILRQVRTIDGQLAAYRRGDYQGQLAIVEGFRAGKSEPKHYLFFRGSACYQLGRLAEAERALRRSLALEKDARLALNCRDELGRVIMAQERWDEAAACFEECIAAFPKRATGHRSMAELWLRRGGEREAALVAARAAEACDRSEKVPAGKLGQECHDQNLAESLGVLAWALARKGCGAAEVERMFEEARALCGETTKPILAEIHFFAGRACEELGDAKKSRQHFRLAADADPAGYYGRIAVAAMTAVANGEMVC